MRNVLVYVAHPISKGSLVANLMAAHGAGMALLKAAVPCIVPGGSCFWGSVTLNMPPLAGFIPEVLPTGTVHGDWYGMDLVIVSRCDAVLRLPGESTGADLEVARATELGKPVFHDVDSAIAWANKQESHP